MTASRTPCSKPGSNVRRAAASALKSSPFTGSSGIETSHAASWLEKGGKSRLNWDFSGNWARLEWRGIGNSRSSLSMRAPASSEETAPKLGPGPVLPLC